jgi:hypothetical protein
MVEKLTPRFITKYAESYVIVAKLHLNVYELKLPTSFMAHLTFHVSKLKVFFWNEKKPNLKQKMWLEINAIEDRLVNEVYNII